MRLTTFLLLLVVSNVGFAQEISSYQPRYVDPLTEQWRVRQFSQLKGKGLLCLAEDPQHAVWFGVDGGAIRYDGIRWQSFDARSGLPAAVIGFASVGELFFAATGTGVYVLQGRKFQKIFPPTQDRPWRIDDIASAKDGSLWAATNWGAVRLSNVQASDGPDDSRRTTLYAAEAIVRHFQGATDTSRVRLETVGAAESHAWQSGIGLCCEGPGRNGNVVIAVAADGPAARNGVRIGDQIVKLNGELRDTVYQREFEHEAGTQVHLTITRLGVAEPIDLELTAAQLEGSYETFRPYRITEDVVGSIWFATRPGQIIALSFDDGATQWVHHTRKYDLPTVAVPSIAATGNAVAATGRITTTRDLIQYDGRKWRTVDLKRGIGTSVSTADHGGWLVGTNGAVISVDADGQVTEHGLRDYGIFGNDVFVLRTSDGATWIAGKESIALRIASPDNTITSYNGIIYQDTGPDLVEWFISDQLSVVSRNQDQWNEYSDVMSAPLRVKVANNGDVWVAGSHKGVAATARLVDGCWQHDQHSDLSWAIDRRAVFEDRDGRMWFGAAVNQDANHSHRGGVMRFDGSQWTHIAPTNRLDFVYGMAQSGDGSVWCAGPSLVQIRPDDRFGSEAALPLAVRGFIDSLANDKAGNLWVGTRTLGLVRIPTTSSNPKILPSTIFNEATQLSNNRVKSVLPLSDGTLLAGTPAGFDRFDGKSFSPEFLPAALSYSTDYGGMHESRSGNIWINETGLGYVSRDLASSSKVDMKEAKPRFRAFCCRPDTRSPETEIVSSLTSVAFGDQVNVICDGTDFFDATPRDKLTYSWRLGAGAWSDFARTDRMSFKELPVGMQRLQVRARDAHFNIDASPAVIEFQVQPMLWQRAWFQALILVTTGLLLAAAVQTTRVFARDSALRTSNQHLLRAEQSLKEANQSLEHRVIQRTRELQDANQQLQASEVQYRSIVEDQTEYIVRFDALKTPTFVNGAFRRALGYSDETAVNEMPELARLRQVTRELTANSPTGVDLQLIVEDGPQPKWEQWHGRELSDNSGTLIGYQAVGRDITELHETEHRLSEKEHQLAHLSRVSALGEMVASISHEINQPLATIANFSSASLMVLDRDVDLSTPDENTVSLRQWIQRISDQTNRIGKIMRSLRRFGRPGSKRETFKIIAAVEEALALCESRTRKIVRELVYDCPDDLPAVCADRIQIEQVLVNLIRNACDAMDDPAVEQRKLRIGAVATDGVLKVSVTDSGPGLMPDEIHRVFDTFATTKSDGMGIGLAISRSIVEAHDGKLYAVDYADGGRFEFTLPSTQACKHS